MNYETIHALPAELNPIGTIAALIIMGQQQRLINESNIQVFANRQQHPVYGDIVVISCDHLAGEKAGSKSTRAVLIPNQPESMPTQPVRFMEFDNEYELRQYAPIQVASIALDAVYFLMNGDLPDFNDD